MTSSLLPLLKIAIVPIMLMSILLRNRAAKRRRATDEAVQKAAVQSARTAVVTLEGLDSAGLGAVMDRLEAGEPMQDRDGHALILSRVAVVRADALWAEGRSGPAQEVLSRALDTEMTERDRAAALLRLARLEARQGRDEAARGHVSEAADLLLSLRRTEARGDILHLAERLADDVLASAADAHLSDPRLTDYGPLLCLRLAGRETEARDIASDLVTRVDRALVETAGDPTGRVDGFPRDLLIKLRGRLSVLGGGRV